MSPEFTPARTNRALDSTGSAPQDTELLDPTDRKEFLDKAITDVEATVVQVQIDVRRVRAAGESPFQIAMASGALYATRARLRTLKELAASLDG